MITQHDLDAIYLEVEPAAREAFERLSRDHGSGFAEHTREYILALKLLDWNREAIRSGMSGIIH